MLTPRQKEVIDLIRRWQKEKGFAPTITEIATHLGVKSRSMVQRIIEALEQQGYLSRVAGARRNLKLLKQLPYTLPRLGRIAAGEPMAAVAQYDDALNLGQLVADDRFVLEVKGDSMAGDAIRDGDLVICEQCEAVKAHEIAVVLVRGEEATLKRVQLDPASDTVRLVPSNPDYTAKIYFSQDVQIQGRYLGLIRWQKK